MKGSDNRAADALSRLEVSAFHVAQQPGVDLVDMAAIQLTDLELQHLKDGTTSGSTSLVLKAVPLPMADSSISAMFPLALHGLCTYSNETCCF